MDFQSALICVLVFIVSAALLLLISMFGMREKSYEEALAEQRQLTGGLLNTSHRPKSKEKKQKKAGKKMKDKLGSTSSESNDTVAENVSEKTEIEKKIITTPIKKKPSTPTEKKTVAPIEKKTVAPIEKKTVTPIEKKIVIATTVHSKPHVEFEEPPTIVNTATNLNNKKRVKKEKVKPILLNKEKSPIAAVDTSKTLSTNHFDKIHPKDDFELLHSHKEETKPEKQETENKGGKSGKGKQLPVEKESSEHSPKQQQKNSKMNNKEKKQQQHQQQSQQQQQQKTIPVEESIVAKEQHTVAKSLPAKVDSTNNTIKDKKKKKSEFNTLQQMTAASDKHGMNVGLLLQLVRKADLSRSEIQILIDLLLNKQHEAPAILDEWSEGRADPVQKLKRQLADKERALTAEQEALVGAQAKLREVRAELNSERSRLLQNYRGLEETMHAKHNELQQAAARLHAQNQKIQQMQAQLNEEVMTSHKLREELNAMQLQRQQMDMHISQKQETEASLQSQLNQLHNEIQEQKNLNTQLSMELHSVRDKNHGEKELLHERIRAIESQALHYKNESEQRQDVVRQLDESRRTCVDLEHRCTVAHHTEAELTMRVQQQLEEQRRIEANQAKLHDDNAKMQAECGRLTHLHKQTQDENAKIVADLQSQLAALQLEKSQLEAANGAASEDRSKEIEILNLQNELSSLRSHVEQRDVQLNTELDNAKRTLQDAQAELKTQRNKNDELRKKNWKVMEALNETETKLRNSQKQKQTVTVNDDNDTALTKTKQEEEDKSRKFLQRLFPEIKLSQSNNWMMEAESEISKLQERNIERNVNNETDVDIAKLQAEAMQYRNIIEDTEGMLNKLQSHIEQEEINWKQQIYEKDVEIETLREQNRNPDKLQMKIGDLEGQLMTEAEAKRELETECEALRTRLATAPVTHTKQMHFGSGSTNLGNIEQIVEEKLRLADELTREQKRCQSLTEELLSLQAATLPSKVVEHHTSNGTSTESAELPNSASSSSVSPTTTKPRNRNKKKKTTAN